MAKSNYQFQKRQKELAKKKKKEEKRLRKLAKKEAGEQENVAADDTESDDTMLEHESDKELPERQADG